MEVIHRFFPILIHQNKQLRLFFCLFVFMFDDYHLQDGSVLCMLYTLLFQLDF